jgi:lysyl-tRNA synthetase class 2
VLHAIRTFFLEHGFLEVQTPLRTPAPAPEPHIDAFRTEGWFLATSPELYMKRLLAAGYERIYQISQVFRRGEEGRWHHPEFTMLEWYRLSADYRDLQDDCQELLNWICQAIGTGDGFRYRSQPLEASPPWERLSVREAFTCFAGWDPLTQFDADRFDMDLVEKVEPRLGLTRPCLLVDYPASQAALARLKPDAPMVAERFELYWAGLELANGFTELTDPAEQRERFAAVNVARSREGREVYPSAELFLASLDQLPPCAGIALGVDRLVLLLADAAHLDEVVAFPPKLA